MDRKFQDFDKKAAEWNISQQRIKRSETISEHIRDKIRLDKNTTDMLDFGCGNGHLAFILSHYVRSVTGVDGSEQMICLLKNRIAESKLLNIEALQLDIEHEVHTLNHRQFDLITSSMVLHHLADPSKVIVELKHLLKADGVICLIDLDTEDGSFHDNDPFIPHHGFEREAIKTMLEGLGFFSITLHTPLTITKTGSDGITRDFPLFMAIGSNNPPTRDELNRRGELAP